MKSNDRVNLRLLQSYKMWAELDEVWHKHNTRSQAIARGDSAMNLDDEVSFMAMIADQTKKHKKVMMDRAKEAGPIFDWLVDIKGIADHTAAKLIALFDHPKHFRHPSAFHRFAGMGLYKYWVNENGYAMAPITGWKSTGKKDANGDTVYEYVEAVPEPGWTLKIHRDVSIKGWRLPYNQVIKNEMWVLRKNLVCAKSPVYYEEYIRYKARKRIDLPDHTARHIDNMGKRYLAKIFLTHFYIEWSTVEGLPVPMPYQLAHMGSGHAYVQPEKHVVKVEK